MTIVNPETFAREIRHDPTRLAYLAFAATRHDEIVTRMAQGESADIVASTPPPLDVEELICLFARKKIAIELSGDSPVY